MFSMSSFLRLKKENVSLVYRIYFVFLCSGAMSTLLGALLPAMQEEYSMSYALRGYVLSAHQIGNLCAVWIAGFLPYAVGRKCSTLMMGSGIVIGLVLMTISGNPFLLLLAFALTGIGRGTFSNITNVVVSENAGNKAAGLNLLHASFAVGAFISPFIAVAATRFQWRISSWIVAAMVACSLFFVATSNLSSEKMDKKKGQEVPFARSFGFWLNTAIMFFYLCGEGSLVGWLVTYFKDSGIMSTSLAQTMQSLLWIMILCGRLTCATISNRMNKPLLILIMGVLMAFFFVLMISVDDIVVIVVALLGVGFSMSGIYPTTLSTMDPRFNSSTVAVGTCIATATFGAILMPVVVGQVAEVAGIAGGVATISIALFAMVALMVVKLIRSVKGLV